MNFTAEMCVVRKMITKTIILIQHIERDDIVTLGFLRSIPVDVNMQTK